MSMPRRVRLVLGILLGILLGGMAGAAPQAHAQTLRLVSTQSLTFGQVAPRQSRVIAPGAAGAAVFTVQGPANATLVLTITPPMLLTNTRARRCRSVVGPGRSRPVPTGPRPR
jgi:hypothetical protein